MESVILLLMLAGILVVTLRATLAKGKNSQEEQTELPQGTEPWRPPFDANSAKHLTTPQFVQGSAYVVDGDTLVIKKTQIRLFGIDAPEMNHPYGKSAKWALISLCKGRSVRAEITDQDAFGRTVARCYLEDGRDLSAEMVRLGMAIDWPKFSGGEYRALETPDARKKLWLATARQKGHMHVWARFEANQSARAPRK